VVSGEVEVKQGARALARLGAGDVFGEMGLLHRKPASADVVAVGRAVTLSLPRRSFDEVAVKHPELLAEVYRILVEREEQNRGGAHEVSEDEIVL
jgi:CRP-like cAMP-binding protein